jgi:hypothetical protein
LRILGQLESDVGGTHEQKEANTRRRPKKKAAVSLVRSAAAEYRTYVVASGQGGVEAGYADKNV